MYLEQRYALDLLQLSVWAGDAIKVSKRFDKHRAVLASVGYFVYGVAVRAPELPIPQFRTEIRPESNAHRPGPSNRRFYMVLGYMGGIIGCGALVKSTTPRYSLYIPL